jgi:hypothetical protein
MKRMIFLSACLALSALASYGQNAKGGQVLITPKPVEKPNEENKTPATPPFATKAELSKPVHYGGYLIEVLQAEKKRSLFDLSTPLNPKKDSENVFWNSSPDMAQPIILFRIVPKH